MIQELFIDEINQVLKEIKNSEVYGWFGNPKTKDIIGGAIYTYKVGGKIQAYFGIYRCNEKTICLSYLLVLKPYRRQGIATEIINWIIDKYSNDTIYGFVDRENKVALNFYKISFKFLKNDGSFGRYIYSSNEKDFFVKENSYEVVFCSR